MDTLSKPAKADMEWSKDDFSLSDIIAKCQNKFPFRIRISLGLNRIPDLNGLPCDKEEFVVEGIHKRKFRAKEPRLNQDSAYGLEMPIVEQQFIIARNTHGENCIQIPMGAGITAHVNNLDLEKLREYGSLEDSDSQFLPAYGLHTPQKDNGAKAKVKQKKRSPSFTKMKLWGKKPDKSSTLPRNIKIQGIGDNEEACISPIPVPVTGFVVSVEESQKAAILGDESQTEPQPGTNQYFESQNGSLCGSGPAQVVRPKALPIVNPNTSSDNTPITTTENHASGEHTPVNNIQNQSSPTGNESLPSISKPSLAVRPLATHSPVSPTRSNYLTTGTFPIATNTPPHVTEPSDEDEQEEAQPPIHITQVSDQYLTLTTADRRVFHLYYNACPTCLDTNNRAGATPYLYDVPEANIFVSVDRRCSGFNGGPNGVVGSRRNSSTMPATIQLDNGMYLTFRPKRTMVRPRSRPSMEFPDFPEMIILPSNPESTRRPQPREPTPDDDTPSLTFRFYEANTEDNDEQQRAPSDPSPEPSSNTVQQASNATQHTTPVHGDSPAQSYHTNSAEPNYQLQSRPSTNSSSSQETRSTVSPPSYDQAREQVAADFQSLGDVRVSSLNSLSVQQLGDCLRLLKMPHHIHSFHLQQVDGSLASRLNEDMLKQEFSFSPFEAMKFTQFVRGWRPKKT